MKSHDCWCLAPYQTPEEEEQAEQEEEQVEAAAAAISLGFSLDDF